MKTRLLIADDHAIVRDGIRSLLQSEKDFTVVGEAANGRQAVKQATELRPDVVIMDIAMPELKGVEATRQIMARNPCVIVIALSMHGDKSFVADMLKAGAVGYLQKSCAFRHLVRAIRTAMAGNIYLNPDIIRIVVEGFRRKIPDTAMFQVLSAKEREVLQLLSEGHSSKEIANRLGVTSKTIDTHRQNIMDKLGLRSVAALTKYAIREGLTSVDV